MKNTYCTEMVEKVVLEREGTEEKKQLIHNQLSINHIMILNIHCNKTFSTFNQTHFNFLRSTRSFNRTLELSTQACLLGIFNNFCK